MKLTPDMMFRVVDVKRALIQRRYPTDIDITFDIEISNPTVQWNQGVWHVNLSKGKVDVKRTICNAAVRCDIQTFSQIFLGYITPIEAESFNRLNGNKRIIETMNCIFKPSTTFNNNRF